jgi:hypothetical protein
VRALCTGSYSPALLDEWTSFLVSCGFRAERFTDEPLPSGTSRPCVEMRKALRLPSASEPALSSQRG